MKLSRRFNAGKALLVLLLFHGGAAHAQLPSDECRRLIQIPRNALTSSDSTSPEEFKSRLRNRVALWWNKRSTTENVKVTPRVQCFGTCGSYALNTAFEAELKSRGHLQQGDYLLNALPILKIAWMTYQKSGLPEDRLNGLASGHNLELLQVAKMGPTFYLRAEDVRLIGGTSVIEQLEHDMLRSLNGPPSKWKFWSKHDELKELLDSDFEGFVRYTQQLFVGKLRAQTGRDIELGRLSIRGVELRGFENITLSRLSDFSSAVIPFFVTQQRREWAFEFQGPPEFDYFGVALDRVLSELQPSFRGLRKHSVEEQNSIESLPDQLESKERAFRMIVEQLAAGRPVVVAINRLFSHRESAEHSNHAVVLTGFVTNKDGSLKGFKYINSWGSEWGASGHGYISLEQASGRLNSAFHLEGLELEPRSP